MFKRRKADGTDAVMSDHESAMAMLAEQASSPGAREAGTSATGFKNMPGGGSLVWMPGKHSDGGLGVPPFRPAATRESEYMSRAPSNPGPANGAPQPASPRSAATAGRAAIRELSDRRTLVVGRGISLQGTVQDAERFVVEGTVEASTVHAAELSVSHGGLFKGEAEVEEADIAGTMDGTLTVSGSLVVRSTGRVLGTARCRRLQVEDGGQISGRVEMIADSAAALEAPRLAASMA